MKKIKNSLNDSSNLLPTVRVVVEKLGVFQYTETSDTMDVDQRKPTLLENGAIYVGEWNVENQRHGKGKVFFKDGSIFEGHWLYGMVNGLGRHIHSDGAYYLGQWKDDMVHGKGILMHKDGASYDGEWSCDQ